MQYIILDLEWNQPLSYQSAAYRKVGDRLIFEMIQIGAVKLNESMEIIDSISIPIQPTCYLKIHPRIQRMTHLGPEELEGAPHFPEAMAQFAAWCGEDYALLTWGCDDVSVLKQNMDFFGCDVALPPLCDLQRMFRDVYECQDRKALKAAMEMLGIEPDESLSFHNALNDAYYTALVFARMPEPHRVLEYPQAPKQLIHQDRLHRSRLRGETYGSVAEALAAPDAAEPACPACGRKTALEENSYVQQTADKFIGISHCPVHGPLLLKLRLMPADEGKCVMSLTVSKAAPSNIAYVHTKRLQMAQKARQMAEAGVAPPDPDEALQAAERTSMPFED